MIPFLDLKSAYTDLKNKIDEAIFGVLTSGQYIHGEEVEAFEREWAAYSGAEHSVGVANGLDALILSLRVLGVGEGDEVIVPSNTFIATWLAVTAVGAKPIPVEPQINSFNMDVEKVARAITPRTKVVLPVHLYGEPADIDEILALGRSKGLAIVEDAAQAHGATYRNRKIGSHGDLVCWSFYPGKNLGAVGDAGAITTNSALHAEKLRSLRNYGSRAKYVNDDLGCNSRLDPIQAAVLRVKLRHLDEWTERRRHIARVYLKSIKPNLVILPTVREDRNSSWHLFVVRSSKRQSLQAGLQNRGIQTLIHYPIPPHMQMAYRSLGIAPEALPIAKLLSEQVLSLPMGPHLSIEDAKYVASTINEIGEVNEQC